MVARVFAWMVGLSILGMWVAASVAGAGMQLSNVVVSFTAVSLVLVGALVGSTVGWRAVRRELTNIPIVRKIVAALMSDWLRSLFLLTTAPLLLLYACLSLLNQALRRRVPFMKELQALRLVPDAEAGAPENEAHLGIDAPAPPGAAAGGDDDDDDVAAAADEAQQLEDDEVNESELWLTLACHRQFRILRGWAWTSVLTKMIWWGIIFVVIIVGVGKAVTLFLAFLNNFLGSSFSLPVTTLIFYCIGLAMFLLPPVPGVPVYLSGGVILTSAAQDTFGFWGAAAYTTGVCFLCKLGAICGQQKGIGERMSGNVAVRKFVGVNSMSIRAIEKILSAPGLAFLDIKKVAILCGGPDWPTSVLTGILKLSLPDMLMGSFPVLLLIAPCVLAGAFQLRKPEGGIWQSLGGVTLAVAALVQMMALVAAGHFIERAAAEHEEELRGRAPDRAVLALEEEDRHNQEVRERATRWERVPALARLVLALGATAAAVTCYAVQLGGSYCFAEFEVTDSIDAKLGGSWTNILLRPWGTYAALIFGGSLVCLLLFNLWAGCAVRGASDHVSGDQASRNAPLLPAEHGTEVAVASHASMHEADV